VHPWSVRGRELSLLSEYGGESMNRTDRRIAGFVVVLGIIVIISLSLSVWLKHNDEDPRQQTGGRLSF